MVKVQEDIKKQAQRDQATRPPGPLMEARSRRLEQGVGAELCRGTLPAAPPGPTSAQGQQ